MEKFNNKAPIVFYVSMLLLCAVLISAYMTGDLYAKYSTSASGGDSARVAKFSVSYDVKVDTTTIMNGSYTHLEPINIGKIQPGGTGTPIVVYVTNISEVAVEVKVNLVNITKNLPLEIISYDSSVLSPNGSGVFTFKVFWPKGANDLALMGMTDMFELQITVEQVD